MNRPARAKATVKKPARKTGPACPICGGPVSREHRPFCSKRCADTDLSHWLGGRYAVPGEPLARAAPEDDDESAP